MDAESKVAETPAVPQIPQVTLTGLADAMRTITAALRRLLGEDDARWLARTTQQLERETEECSLEQVEHFADSAEWQDHLSQFEDKGGAS